MSTVWVICGAGRGVGKTFLAQRLCGVLPDAVYAKQGHGKARGNKPRNFFRTDAELAAFIKKQRETRRHIVVESNGMARRGEGDVIVFVDGRAGVTDFREDSGESKMRADVVVCVSGSPEAWRRVLTRKLRDRELAEKTVAIMSEQREWIGRTTLQIRSKVWFMKDGRHVFGPGLARLLAEIERLKTLQEVARRLGISYRCAWGRIRAAEEHLGCRLVMPHAGGTGGGKTILDRAGRRLLEIFRRVDKRVASFADHAFTKEMSNGEVNEKQ